MKQKCLEMYNCGTIALMFSPPRDIWSHKKPYKNHKSYSLQFRIYGNVLRGAI